jgi:ribosomal protein L7/L12
MGDKLTDDQVNQIRLKLQIGRKIEAVKLYKDWTGSSLVEAKNYVERLAGDHEFGLFEAAEGVDANQMDMILDAIRNGQKLQAVKLHKESSGSSLKESKEFVERLMNQLQIDDPASAPASSGCASVILLIVVLGSGLLLNAV